MSRRDVPISMLRFGSLVWLTLLAPAFAQEQEVAPPPALPDPNVQAILETDPTTPFELVRAIDVLIDLRQPAAARPLLEKLSAANLDDRTSFELMETFGPATMLKIARSQPLSPQGKQFADQILAAATRYARDPARLDELIAQLASPSAGQRNLAIEGLRIAGADVVVPLLRVLADPQQADAHAAAAAAIARIGADAEGPLLGALLATEPEVAAQAALMLAQLRSPLAVNRLLGLAYADDRTVAAGAQQALTELAGRLPTASQGATYLEKQAHDYLAGRVDLPRGRRLAGEPNVPLVIDLWYWDAARQTSVAQAFSPEQARTRLAAEAAAAAARLTSPDAPTYYARQRTHLSSGLDVLPDDLTLAEVRAQFSDATQQMLAADSRLLLDVLDESLKYRLTQAAAWACNLLAEQGGPAPFATGGQPNALIRALADPDRQVRFAALDAVMRRKPAGRFAGSSQVPIAVAWFVAGSGVPRAVAAASSLEEAARLAGLAAELGYDIDTATDGATLLDVATRSGGVELILLDSTLLAPRPIDMIPLLRNDPRTAGLPVALVIVPGEEDFYARTLNRDRLTGAIIRPHSSQALQFQMGQLWRSAGYRPTDPAQRMAQAQAAVGWALELAQTGQRVFNLERLLDPLSQALFVPELNDDAARALALIGNPEAQRTLVDFASQNLLPLDSRQAAAAAFCQSASRWGLLLTSGQLQLQYDRYNASEFLDRETQNMLSSILDCLESGRSPVASAP